MRVRPVAILGAAALALAAGPAAAQSAAELLGVYHLNMTSKTGADCPEGDDEDLSIEIRRISGARLMFGDEGRGDDEVAEYDPSNRTFRFEQVSSGGSERNGVFTGRFTRMADAVRLDMTIDIPGCTGKMTGFRPAPPIADAGPPPPTASSEAATSPAAAAPAAADAAQPAAGMSTNQMLMFGGGGLALLAAGVGIGWFMSRRRADPPPRDEAPPAPPPPPDPPAA